MVIGRLQASLEEHSEASELVHLGWAFGFEDLDLDRLFESAVEHETERILMPRGKKRRQTTELRDVRHDRTSLAKIEELETNVVQIISFSKILAKLLGEEIEVGQPRWWWFLLDMWLDPSERCISEIRDSVRDHALLGRKVVWIATKDESHLSDEVAQLGR
jgi:hypothetical protein